jgi:drug/metabolite transporter (DMT)-like permease
LIYVNSSHLKHDTLFAMNIPLQAILIAICIHILWGANPVAVKFSLITFPPLWSAFIRFVLGILCIACWAWIRRIPIWPQRREWPALIIISLLFTLQIGAMNIGADLTTGTMAAILISTNPLFAACFAHLLISGDQLTLRRSLGLLIALLGTVITLLQSAGGGGLQFSNWGNWITLLSAALLGWRLAYSALSLRQIDPVRVALWQMAFSLPLFALGAITFETIRWHQLNWASVAGVAYQGIVIAGLGFMVNFHLMKTYRPSTIMSFNFVAPISGVLLSLWFLGDQVSWHLWVGVATVGLGLVLITRK